MQLPKLFASPPAAPSAQLFFAIHVSEVFVQSVLWRVENGTIDILTQSNKHPWHDDETCIAAVDTSLQELGKESEPVKEALFALSSDWVNEAGILAAKKPLFQRITKELSLTAVGFVVTSEALFQHLTQVISPQLSLFLVEVETQSMTASLVRQGQIVRTEKTGRSGDATSDLTEALAHFTEKSFPSRIILFSAVLGPEELEDMRQQLFAQDWPTVYPFVETPIIDIYAAEILMEIIVRTGGRAVAEAKGLIMADAPALVQDNSQVLLSETEMQPTQTLAEAVQAGNAQGIIPSSPMSNVEPIDPQMLLNPSAMPPTSEALMQQEMTTELSGEPINQPAQLSWGNEPVGTEENFTPPVSQPTRQLPAFLQIPPHHPPRAFIPFAIMGIVLGIVVLVIVAMTASSTLTTANVLVVLKTENVSKEVSLTLDPSIATSDPSKLLLKAEVVNKEVQGQKTIEASGTKLIGDKAKGKVTLFNRTPNIKVFPVGTVVTNGKQKYTLDQATTVASASTGQNFESKPGTADAAVTASAIGVESNIGENVDLTVDTFAKDTYVARTNGAIGGGTSREIQAVSKEDRDKLLAQLKKELSDQVVNELKQQSNGDSYVIPTNRVKVVKAVYSAEVGKETNSLSLQLTLQVEALSSSVAELQPLAESLLQKEAPANYDLSNVSPQIVSTPTSTSTASAQVVLTANLSAMARPKIDANALENSILGKSEADALKILQSKSEVKQARVELLPALLARFGKVPMQADRVNFVIEPKVERSSQ